MLAKAVADVLKKHPVVNAAYVEGGIKYNKGTTPHYTPNHTTHRNTPHTVSHHHTLYHSTPHTVLHHTTPHHTYPEFV